ncbi:MAG: hypothetical protein KAR35_00540, partial [Candidatus Heimdallarchaeota archaeon]|nr:hypothetical protein [Candidatus Heimdallarchaeota archaeon]MCK5047839.1 hypothetical protein [Candidatus Heimdallarchaeota archaeon]
ANIHPYGCDITYFNGELAKTTKDTLAEFLCDQFEGVNLKIAEGFFNELNIDPDKHPNELSVKEIRRIVVDGFQRAFAESKEMTRKRDRVFKFEDPRGDVLSPLGANRLRKGLEKELNPTFVEAITRAPRAYSGHPFIIEAAIGFGGKVSSEAAQKAASDNKIIYRYANRIPLIFSSSNDVIYQAVQEIKWSDYGLTRQSDPLAIAVSLVSTKIPFPETSKEYISNVSEIAEEVQLALLQLGRRLKTFLTKAKRSRRERARQSRFNRYAPDTMNSLMRILAKENILAADYSKISPQVITALSSGEKKLVRSKLPKGSSISSANVWFPENLKEKLVKKKIITVGEFLKEESPDLATLLQVSEERIEKIKRQTIVNLDDHEISPEIDAEFYVSKDIEKNFHIRDGKREALRFHLSRAFPRRWILTPFDYVNNSVRALRRVEGLDSKLLERKKEEIRLSLKVEEEESLETIEDSTKEQPIDLESLSESDLSQDEEFQTLIDQIITDEASEKKDPEKIEEALKHELVSSEEIISPEEEKQLFKVDKDGKPVYLLSQIFPSFSQVQDEVSGYLSRKKIKNVEDLLVDLNRPLIPPPPKQIVEYIIGHMQSVYAQISETHPSFLNEKMTRMSPDWTDGVTKNFFHRRSIESVQDFIDKPIEDLSNILQIARNLVDVFCKILAENEESPNLELQFEGVSKKTHQEIMRMFKRERIETVAQFLNTDTYDTVSSPKYDIFINALILESKFLTVQSLEEQGFSLPLEFLKEIDTDLIFELNKLKVMSTTEFLTCPNDALSEIEQLSEEKIIKIKKELGTPLPDWFPKKLRKWLVQNGIVSLEQVISGKIITSPDDKLIKEISTIEKILHTPVIFAGKKVVGYADHLYELGINTIGKLLIWPNNEIINVIDLSSKEIESIKADITIEKVEEFISTNSKPISLLETSKALSSLLKENGVNSIQEIYFKYFSREEADQIDPSGIKIVREWLHKNIKILLKLIEGQKTSVKNNAESALVALEEEGITTVRQFFNSSKEKILNQIRGKRKKEAIEAIYSELEKTIPGLKGDKKALSFAWECIKLQRLLNKPVTMLEGINVLKIDNFTRLGIRTIIQYLSLSQDTIDRYDLGLADKGKIKIKDTGFPLGIRVGNTYETTIDFEYAEVPRFSSEEILILKDAGYNSLDDIYFKAEKLTFTEAKIEWEMIEKLKRLLAAPVVLLSWSREVKDGINHSDTNSENEELVENSSFTIQESIPAVTLNRLKNAGITRTIEFLLYPGDKLAQIMRSDQKQVDKMRERVSFVDSGFELEELDLFSQAHIRLLEEQNIYTLEDLYFSTNEDQWEITEVPWTSIESVKDILNVPLTNLSNIIDLDFIKILRKEEIHTILALLLASNKGLEQKTGVSQERWENIKLNLDLSIVRYTFNLPVSLFPGFTYSETEMLRKIGIDTIIKVIREKTSIVAKTTKRSSKEITKLISSITPDSIFEARDEIGIDIKSINVFDRRELRQIARSGVFEIDALQSLQEVYYEELSNYPLMPVKLRKIIESIKQVMGIPIERLGTVSEENMSFYLDNGFDTLGKILFVTEDELEDDLLSQSVREFYKEHIQLGSLISLNYIRPESLDPQLNTLTSSQYDSLLSLLLGEYNLSPKETSILIREQIDLKEITGFLRLPIIQTPLYREGIDEHIKSPDVSINELVMRQVLTEEYGSDEFDDRDIVDSLIHFKNIFTSENAFKIALLRMKVPINALGLPLDAVLSLVNNGIRTFIDFVTTSPREIAEISGLTLKSTSAIFHDLHFAHNEREFYRKAHLLSVEQGWEEEHIELLREEAIVALEDLYLKVPKDHEGWSNYSDDLHDKVRKVIFALNGSLDFIPDLSQEVVRTLEHRKITKVGDFFFLIGDESISSDDELRMSANKIISDIGTLVANRKLLGVNFSNLGITKKDLSSITQNYQVEYIQDLISLTLNPSFIEETKVEVLEKIKSYESSIVFAPLTFEQQQDLITNEITSIRKFIRTSNDKLTAILNTDIDKIRNSITSKAILGIKQDKKVKLKAMTGFHRSIGNQLLKASYDNLQDFYFLSKEGYLAHEVSEATRDNTYLYLEKAPSSIKEVPITSLKLLHEKRLFRVIDLFSASTEVLDSVLIPRNSQRKIRQGNFTIRKSTPLPEKLRMLIEQELHSIPLEFHNIEDLFFTEILFPWSEKSVHSSKPNVFRTVLASPILFLYNMPLIERLELTKRGIWSILEFLTADARFLSQDSSLSIKAIETIKSEIIPENVNEERVKTGHQIDDYLILPENFSPILLEMGLSTVEDLYLSFLEGSLQNQEVKTWLVKIKLLLSLNPSALNEEIDLSLNLKEEMMYSSIGNVASLMMIPVDQISLSTEVKEWWSTFNKKINWGEFINEAIPLLDNNTLEITPLKEIKWLPKKWIKRLPSYGYQSLNHLLVSNSFIPPTQHSPSALSDFVPSLDISIATHSDLSTKQVEKLVANGINTLAKLILSSSKDIVEILGLEELEIKQIKNDFQFSTLIDKTELTKSVTELEFAQKIFSSWKRWGVNSPENILSYIPSTLRTEEKQILREALRLFETPITLINKDLEIEWEIVQQLKRINVINLKDLLYLNHIHLQSKIIKKIKLNLGKLSKDEVTQASGEGLNVELFKDLKRKEVTRLQRAGVSTIGQFMILTPETLASKTGIEKNLIEDFQDKLKAPFIRIKDIDRTFSRELIENTSIRTVEEYFNHLRTIEKTELIPESIIIDDEITIVDKLPSNIKNKVSSQTGFQRLSFMLLPNNEEVIQLEPSFTEEIIKCLQSSSSYLSLPSRLIDRFQQNKFTTIAEIVIEPYRDLSNVLKVSLAEVDKILSTIDWKEINEKKKNDIHQLKNFNWCSVKELEALSEIGIDTLIELINSEPLSLFITQEFSQKLEEIKKDLDLPIASLKGLRNERKELNLLWENGIITVNDLFIKLQDELGDKDEEIINKWAHSISRQQIILDRTESIELESLFKGTEYESIIQEKISLIKIEDLYSIHRQQILAKEELDLLPLINVLTNSSFYLFNYSSDEFTNLPSELQTLGDVFLTPLDTLSKQLDISLPELKTTITNASISEIDVMKNTKSLPISDFSLFADEIVNELSQYQITHFADLKVFDKERIENMPKRLKREIEKVTEISPLAIPQIAENIERVNALVNSSIQTFLDIQLHPRKELIKILGIEVEEEIITYFKELLATDLLKPARIASSWLFTDDDLIELKNSNIQSYQQLAVIRKKEISTFSKPLLKKIKHITETDLKEVIPSKLVTNGSILGKVKLVLTQCLELDSIAPLSKDEKESMQLKDSISEVAKWLRSKGTVISDLKWDEEINQLLLDARINSLEYLSLLQSKDELKDILKGVDTTALKPILKGLMTPIVYYLNFSEESMQAYEESKVSSIAQMFSIPDKWIRDILPISAAKLREAKQSFNLTNLNKTIENSSTAVNYYKWLSSTEIEKLEAKEIRSFDDIYWRINIKTDENGLTEKIGDWLRLPILDIPKIYSNLELFFSLKQAGVESIYDLLRNVKEGILSKQLHASARRITQYASFAEIVIQREETGFNLSKLPKMSKTIITQLKALQIETMSDIITFGTSKLNDLELSDKEKSYLDAFVSVLDRPLIFLDERITGFQAFQWSLKGVQTVQELMIQSAKIMARGTVFSELEIDEIRSNWDPEEMMKKLTQQSTDITSTALLSDRTQEWLKEAGIETLETILYGLNPVKADKIKGIGRKTLDQIKEMVFKPVLAVPKLAERAPTKLTTLYDNNVLTVADFLTYDLEKLTKWCNLTKEELQEIRSKTSIASIGNELRRETISINCLKGLLTAEDLTFLKKEKIETLEGLLFPLEFSSKKAQTKIYSLRTKSVHQLTHLIDVLALKKAHTNKLKDNGITTLEAFTLYPAKELRKMLDIKKKIDLEKIQLKIGKIPPPKAKPKPKAKAKPKAKVKAEKEVIVEEKKVPQLSKKKLEGMAFNDLKKHLKTLNLPTTGKKVDLIKRIQDYQTEQKQTKKEAEKPKTKAKPKTKVEPEKEVVVEEKKVPQLTKKKLEGMAFNDLKKHLKTLNLPTTGKKVDLIKRIQDYQTEQKQIKKEAEKPKAKAKP